MPYHIAGSDVHKKMLADACADLHPVYRRLVKLTLDECRLIEDQLAQLDQQMAPARAPPRCHAPLGRSARPWRRSAQQIIAEVGANAAAFPSANIPSSIEQAGMIGGDCRPWLLTAA